MAPDSVDAGDPLLEATPLPSESALPGWRQDAASYYRQLEQISAALMRSLARGLNLDEHIFDEAFVGGLSTLRLIHYPPRSDDSFVGLTEEEGWVTHNGERRYVTGRPHVDTGFVTLLAQDGVEGLQARASDGAWLDVPPLENTLGRQLRTDPGALDGRTHQGDPAPRHRNGPRALFHSLLL